MIKGNDSIEAVSVPGLTTYFANLGMAGRDYAYYQVSFLDFPMNDSLTKIFSSHYIDLSVSVITEWLSFPSLNVSSTRYFNAKVPLEVKRISSIKDLADKLWMAIMNLTLTTAQ